jgi:hypothetical protein
MERLDREERILGNQRILRNLWIFWVERVVRTFRILRVVWLVRS